MLSRSPGDTGRAGGPVWVSGRKLAADLTLPKLRRRWEPRCTKPGEQFTSPNAPPSGNMLPALPRTPRLRSVLWPTQARQPQPMPPGPQLTPCMPPQ
jgi:hypothetical protein